MIIHQCVCIRLCQGVQCLIAFRSCCCVFQGLVDLQKELAKLGGRMERLQAQLDQAVARTWVQQYEERVPQHIREENTRRVRI